MWSAVLEYAFPVVVAMYGLAVLATGSISGFGSRVATGAKARILGLLLIATGAAAAVIDVRLPFGRAITRAEQDAMKREMDIGREVLDLRKRELDWVRGNTPARPEEGGDPTTRLERSKTFLRAMEEFTTERKRRAAEADQKVKELTAEQVRLRGDWEAERAKRQAGNSGRWALALAGLLGVWGLAWLAGRPEDEPAVTPPPGGDAKAGPGSPAA